MMDDAERTETSDSKRGIAQHPRRSPANKSVSLLHSSREAQHQNHRQRLKSPVNGPANVSFFGPQPPYPEKNSSGESSNAEKWFESSNNNVKTMSGELVDNESPFFLRNSSSSEASPDMLGESQSRPPAPHISLPYRAGFRGALLNEMADSSSDDFRSVIDDLTIENKKLRKKLKKYEKLHDAHLEADKLFEIRIHGLSVDKKRELEETLQKFASSLEATPRSKLSSKPSARFAAKLQTASSLANTDSAYASMSGQNQSMQSGQGSKLRHMSQPGMSQEQQQTIQSYLHEIPQGLFPQQQTAMTEKTRRKLVVRRMEQIFAGKGAADSGHQQPMQQQEVSHSAARADRMVQEKDGQEVHQEGAREARIVPIAKHHGESKGAGIRDELSGSSTERMEVDDDDDDDVGEDSDGSSPDQRPTRPLDLDPYRAQVPSENIKYMRHLGFSPPEAGATAKIKDDHGWVYLNVLTNMAQLHTINVTTDFIKRAISENSEKLELSADGRKVRWRGGSSLTRSSSGGSPEDGTHGRNRRQIGSEDRVPAMLSSDSTFGTSENPSKSGQSVLANPAANKLSYIPLFFHREESDEDEDDDESAWSSPPMGLTAAESLALASSDLRTSSPRRRRGDDGPIIFYNKATFFTDLSGDIKPQKVETGDVRHYSTNKLLPIGLPESLDSDEDNMADEKKGPLSRPAVAAAVEHMDMDTDQTSEKSSSLTGLSRPTSTRTSSSEDVYPPSEPMEFEVSGIGGVHPSDNFAIDVKCRQRLAVEGSLPTIPESRNKNYNPRIESLLAELATGNSRTQGQHRTIVKEIISSQRKELPASRLPDPSFYPFGPDGEDEDEDYDSDTDSSTSISSNSLDRTARPLPTSALQQMNWNPMDISDSGSESGDEEEEDDDDMDDDSDESIDLLAEARKLDPHTVHAREREYTGNMADRLADEIPTGSSAATAGGGSGFNSPNIAVEDTLKKAPSLKRVRVYTAALEKGRTKSPRIE